MNSSERQTLAVEVARLFAVNSCDPLANLGDAALRYQSTEACNEAAIRAALDAIYAREAA